jgi:hypothetical protein
MNALNEEFLLKTALSVAGHPRLLEEDGSQKFGKHSTDGG